MRRKSYVCDPNLILRHYQHGGIVPYQGHLVQRGYGIGNLFSSVFRSVVPLAKKYLIPNLKKATKYVAPRLIESGLDVLGDVALRKKNIKQALKERGQERLQELEEKISEMNKIKRKKPKSKKAIPVRRKKRKKDIFD